MSADIVSNQIKKVDIPLSINRHTGSIMPKVEINDAGIKQNLKRLKFTTNTFYYSIAEYIWNGFDANASEVILNYQLRDNGTPYELSVKDNGVGINYEELDKKFKFVFDSEKLKNISKENRSETHGKDGIGRLTFFTFANFAKWTTVYTKDRNYKYDIEVSANSLDDYLGVEKSLRETNESNGTTVTFSGFLSEKDFNKSRNLPKNKKRKKVEELLINHLKTEFCWFLELNKSKNYKLIINGNELDYSDIMDESIYFEIKHEESGTEFKVKYIRWASSLNDEFSKFYYLNEKDEEIYNEYTTFNRKGDKFFHSLYISSNYFNDFNFSSKEGSSQKTLTGDVRSDEIFKYLKSELEKFLRDKRKPFLKEYAKKVIKEFEDEGIIVRKGKDDFELIQIDDLESVIQEIYTFQPTIFSSLSKEQKQTMVGLLNLVLNSEEREQVIEIVDKIVKLDPKERTDLIKILKITNLTKIIRTLNLIKDRYQVIELLDQILFISELGACEAHIQIIVENNTWIFGEQYNLVAAAEVNFENALRKHIQILTEKDEKIVIDHPDKQKQVDVFICRQNKTRNVVNNLIIELKHPKIRIGADQLYQVKEYMRIILGIDRFNASNYRWEFILIGNNFDSKGHIEGEIENKGNREDRLVYEKGNYKIFVQTWSDVLLACKIRHQFIDEKLELEKNKIVEDLKSANEAVKLAVHSDVITA